MDEKYIPLSAALSVAAAWCPDDDGSVGKTGDLREMLDEIEAIEPADVRPVVRSEWVKFGNPNYSPFDDSEEYVYQCLRCKEFQYHQSNFCPNCGADMRPGKEET